MNDDDDDDRFGLKCFKCGVLCLEAALMRSRRLMSSANQNEYLIKLYKSKPQ